MVHAGDGHRNEGEAHREGDQQERAELVGEELPVGRRLTHPCESDREQPEPGHHLRKVALERAVAQHLLLVERQEEEERRDRPADDQRRQVRSRDRAVVEDAERKQRIARPPLDDDEGNEKHRRRRQQPQRSRRADGLAG
jgi:hypothetical protein